MGESTEWSIIYLDNGRQHLGPLSSFDFGQIASALGLLSPLPIYKPDGLDVPRAPQSYKLGVLPPAVLPPAVLWQPTQELQLPSSAHSG